MTVEPEPLALPLAAALLAAGELLGAVPVVPLLPLEHAATRTATPSAAPTPAVSLAGAGIRFNMEFPIVLPPV